MKKLVIRKILILIKSLGFDPYSFFKTIPNLFYFFKTSIKYLYNREIVFDKKRRSILPKYSFPYVCLGDHLKQSGDASGHYFHQDLIVAREIYKRSPNVHFDVGSRVDGFIAHLLSFNQKIIIGDVRPLNFKDNFLEYRFIDLCNKDLNFDDSNIKYKSVSSLHVIEHIGLGRYGDPIDPLGYINAIRNLARIVDKNGYLYLSHPVGFTRVEFNAHNVFSLDYIYQYILKNNLIYEEIHLINDEGNYILSTKDLNKAIKKSANFNYGCVVWILKKI
tara:strand:- start:296 stop:1123 length:828 start_codon:yes stop_codon:yes gene_type:complete